MLVDGLARRAAQYAGVLAAITGPAKRVVAQGGWLRLEGVTRAKASYLPRFTVASEEWPGARGAALFAGLADRIFDTVASFPRLRSEVTP